MVDTNLIKISQLKNLRAIYFYNVNSIFCNNNNNFLGIKVSYGKNESLSFDYRSEYFQQLVLKVYEVYAREKDKNKILLLGDLTEELMSRDTFEFQTEAKELFFQEQGLPSLNNMTQKIKANEEYIKLLLQNILSIYFKHPLLTVNELVGFNNRFNALYSVEVLNQSLSFWCDIEDDNTIKIYINNINGNIQNIEATIKYYYNKVIMHYENKDMTLKGNIIFDSENKTATKEIISLGEVVEYENEKLEIEDEDKKTIDFYTNLLNLPKIKEGVKTSDNCFILSETSSAKTNSNNMMLETKGIHIMLKEQQVNLNVAKTVGFTIDETELLFGMNQEKENITMKLVELDDQNYIIVQRYFPSLSNSNGYYRSNYANKYNYQIIKVKKGTRLDMPFEVLEIFEIEQKTNSFGKIKEIIKERVVK